MTKVQQRIPDNPDLFRVFLQVMHMVRSPSALAFPHRVVDVLAHRAPHGGPLYATAPEAHP